MNIPNILSNKRDQAPKKHASKYGKRLVEMQEEIKDTFDGMLIFDGEEEIIDRLEQKQNELPLHKILDLKDGQSLAIEIKREKLQKSSGRQVTIGPLTDITHTKSLSWKHPSKEKTELAPWEKGIYIILEKKITDPKFPHNKGYHVYAEQIEVPEKNILLPEWTISKRDLTGQEFLKEIEK